VKSSAVTALNIRPIALSRSSIAAAMRFSHRSIASEFHFCGVVRTVATEGGTDVVDGGADRVSLPQPTAEASKEATATTPRSSRDTREMVRDQNRGPVSGSAP
jgi:hypothetical protein